MRGIFTVLSFSAAVSIPPAVSEAEAVPLYGIVEAAYEQQGDPASPYVELSAVATVTRPDGATWQVPLFWDGGRTWRLRFSPDLAGEWRWQVESGDAGLNAKEGAETVAGTGSHGGLTVMKDRPHHFARQDDTPFWFLGDTAWALVLDDRQEKHDRAAAEHYLRTRAAQGFNVVHTALLSEAGWGNAGGPPFDDLPAERINPAYWQEVDERVRMANDLGLTVGLALAWGDKGRREKYPWRQFPGDEARERYARHVAARYSAFDVYFLVSGEWDAEYSAHDDLSEEQARERFDRLGRVIDEADPHGRMIGIHPMNASGSVREFFRPGGWMTFGDYQQNYRDLHARVLESRKNAGPVVNSEYGYHLRDQSGDGVPDKDNSTSTDAMRHATWDVLMAGGYAVTGFGGTYFGGNRDPGPFDVDAKRHDDWEAQIGHTKTPFTSLDWKSLEPADELVTADMPRGKDRRELGQLAPPATTYWCLAEPGEAYVVYARGLKDGTPIRLRLDRGKYATELFDPRTGERHEAVVRGDEAARLWLPPDERDWVLVLTNPK